MKLSVRVFTRAPGEPPDFPSSVSGLAGGGVDSSRRWQMHSTHPYVTCTYLYMCFFFLYLTDRIGCTALLTIFF